MRALALGLGAVAACACAAQAQLTAYGITNTNRLVSFNVASPGVAISNVAVTGLLENEILLGIDARPASVTGELVVVTSANRLMSLSFGGVATPIGSGFSPSLSTQTLGIDFNPTVDRLRVVHSDGTNRRLNPVTGANAASDTSLTYNDGSGLVPRAVGTAYNAFQFGATAPMGSVRQFIIDSTRDILGEVGSQAGGNASFNGGVVTPIGALGIDINDQAGFDIYGPTQEAFISTWHGTTAACFYRVNLATGAATDVGALCAPITDFAIVPTPGSLAVLGLGALMVGRRRR